MDLALALIWYHVWYFRVISSLDMRNSVGIPLSFPSNFLSFLMFLLILMDIKKIDNCILNHIVKGQ